MYVAWTWATIWHRDPTATARLALWEDPGRATADGLLLVASVASVLAVALAIIAGHPGGPGSGICGRRRCARRCCRTCWGRSSWRPPSNLVAGLLR